MFRPRKDQEPGGNMPSGAAPRPGAFLGTLRSEFDEPEEVPQGFRRLEENVETLMAAYDEGRLSKRELAERLSQQRATDRDGGEWTLGATTRAWYRRQGPLSMWMQVPAPSQAIGDPRPGTWQSPLDIPERSEDDQQVETPDAPIVETQTVDFAEQPAPSGPSTLEYEDQSGQDRRMEFPAEYVPGAAPSHETFAPASYDERFDASLAALLSEGIATQDDERSAPAEEDAGPAPRSGLTGPAPRAGAADPFGDLGLGSGGYLGGAEPEPGAYLSDDSAGLSDDYLYQAPSAPASGYGDFLDVDEERAEEQVSPYLDGGGSVTGPGPLESGAPSGEDRDVDSDPSAGAGVPEAPKRPAAKETVDDFFLPDDFFWNDDKN